MDTDILGQVIVDGHQYEVVASGVSGGVILQAVPPIPGEGRRMVAQRELRWADDLQAYYLPFRVCHKGLPQDAIRAVRTQGDVQATGRDDLAVLAGLQNGSIGEDARRFLPAALRG